MVPPIQWAQRKDRIFLSVMKSDLQDLKITFDEDKVSLDAKCNEGKDDLKFELELFNKIVPDECKFENKTRLVEILLIKPESDDKYWTRLLKTTTKQPWLKVDFNRWKDEDESDDESKEQWNMPPGGAGGMGMGGAGGMPGGPGGDFDMAEMMK